MIDRRAGVLALAVSATVLAGCGGGGPPAATDAAPSVVDASGTVGASDVRPLAFSLPQAYRRRGPSYNWGCASCESFEPGGDGSRGRLLTLDGEFKVNSSFPNTPAPASSITFYGITPNGTAIGWNSDERRGFVQFGSTGQTQLLPAHANPRFVVESGIVGGSVCLPDGSDCHAFHWSPSAPVLAEHPLFQAAWMNNAGRMVGHYQPPGRASQLATVDPDGTITPLGFDAGPGLSAWPRYIADDGPVFLNVIREGDGNLDAVASPTALRRGSVSVSWPGPTSAASVIASSARFSQPSARPAMRSAWTTLSIRARTARRWSSRQAFTGAPGTVLPQSRSTHELRFRLESMRRAPSWASWQTTKSRSSGTGMRAV